MKRIVTLLLIFSILLPLCACTQQQEEYEVPVRFYYLRRQDPEHLHHGSADSVLAPETREAAGHLGDLAYLLEQYLAGPESPELVSPCPAGMTVVSAKMEASNLILVLSDEFASLTGIDLTLACACLTRTCMEMSNAQAVQISTQTALLEGKHSITMDTQDLMLLDEMATDPTET